MRKFITVSALALGMLATAAPAQAAYPVPFTPVETIVQAGQNNGFVVASPAKPIPKNAATPSLSVAPATKPKQIALAPVALKQPVAPLLTGLPKKADVVIRLIANSKYLMLGTATTTSKGNLQLPVVKFTKAGTYFYLVTFDNDKSIKLKIVVS